MAVDLTKRVRTIAGHIVPDVVSDYAKKHLPRKYYIESVITHESPVQRFVRRAFTKKRPTLHHLDVHITDHCNLNCRGCEHYSSISKPVFCDLSSTVSDLERLAELFENIEQIYLLGGEPLLHPEVESFVRETRRIFPRTRLYLMTNGILVTRMSESLWNALHETGTTLLCDSYPINLPVEKIDALGAEYDVTVEWMKPTEEFFKIPIDTQGTCDPKKSFDRCRGLSNCAIVRDGHLFTCAHIAYAHIPIEKFGLKGIDPAPEDSIDIHSDVTGDQVVDFLTHPVPWCSHCDFDSFSTYEWGRTSGDVGEWLGEDKPAEETR